MSRKKKKQKRACNDCGDAGQRSRDLGLRALDLRARIDALRPQLTEESELHRALGLLLDSQLLLLEVPGLMFDLTPNQVSGLKDAADTYIKGNRAAHQAKITAGFTSATTAVPKNKNGYNPGSKAWKQLTSEVDCCWDACLLEIIYGIESTFGTNADASLPADKGKAGPYGPFQLDKKTAEEAGLTVNKDNDDRLDLQKAADAAAQTLSRVARLLTFKKTKKCDCCGGAKQAQNSPCCDDVRKLILLGYNCGSGVLEKVRDLTANAKKDACSYADVKAYLDAALKTFESWEKADKRAPKLKEATDYVDKSDVLKKKLCAAY